MLHLQTSEAMNALAENGIDPEVIRLFEMYQNDTCVYELTPSCAEEPDNLRPPDTSDTSDTTGLFGNMIGGGLFG